MGEICGSFGTDSGPTKRKSSWEIFSASICIVLSVYDFRNISNIAVSLTAPIA